MPLLCNNVKHNSVIARVILKVMAERVKDRTAIRI